MNLTISGHHVDVSPSLKSYVTTKLDKVLLHFEGVVDAKVILSVEKHKEKDGQRAECTLHLKGADIFADASNAELYVAIDEMIAKLDRQVVRHKEKIQNHAKDAAKHAPAL